MRSASLALLALSLVSATRAAVVPRAATFTTATSSAPGSDTTARPASDDPNDSFFQKFKNETAEPIRGEAGAKILG